MNHGSSEKPEDTVFRHHFELLKLELELIGEAIRQHDEITRSIKNWAIVTWTASMGAALSQAEFRPFLWLVAAIAVLFWGVDALFRRIQTTFIKRTEQIAEYVNSAHFKTEAETGGPMSLPLMTMRCMPTSRGGWLKQYLRVAKYFSVSALYLGLASLSIAVWVAVYVLGD